MIFKGIIFEKQTTNVELNGVKQGERKVFLERNFQHSLPSHLLGEVIIKKDDNNYIIGDIDMWATNEDKIDIFLKFYPALGFRKEEDGTLKVICASLCSNPNVDPTIKSLGEQVKELVSLKNIEPIEYHKPASKDQSIALGTDVKND